MHNRTASWRFRIAIEDSAATCYSVYFKPSISAKEAHVVDYVITVLVPIGWGKQNISSFSPHSGILTEIQKANTDRFQHYDYLTFMSELAFPMALEAGREVKLFSFCVDLPCGDSLRLIRGLSRFSKNVFKNEINDGATGPRSDYALDKYEVMNSITLFYDRELHDPYFGSLYGSVTGCGNSEITCPDSVYLTAGMPPSEQLYYPTSSGKTNEQANKYLHSGRPVILNAVKTEYHAGQAVLLEPGFSVGPEEGSSFKVIIKACN